MWKKVLAVKMAFSVSNHGHTALHGLCFPFALGFAAVKSWDSVCSL